LYEATLITYPLPFGEGNAIMRLLVSDDNQAVLALYNVVSNSKPSIISVSAFCAVSRFLLQVRDLML
jgi:hypothetical protein